MPNLTVRLASFSYHSADEKGKANFEKEFLQNEKHFNHIVFCLCLKLSGFKMSIYYNKVFWLIVKTNALKTV